MNRWPVLDATHGSNNQGTSDMGINLTIVILYLSHNVIRHNIEKGSLT